MKVLLLLKHHFILLKLITIFIIIKNYLSDSLIDSLTDLLSFYSFLLHIYTIPTMFVDITFYLL